MISALHKIHEIIKRHADYSSPFIVPFGVFGAFNYPTFYLYWIYFGDTHVNDLSFRLIATTLCLLLALKDKWPTLLQQWTPYIWYGTIIFCLPFLVSYNFLQDPFSNSWTVNVILAFFWLIVVLDLASVLITLVVGIVTATLLHMIQGHPLTIPLQTLRDIIVHTAWIIATSLFFIHRKEIVQQEKLKSLQSLAGAIAHEMRTPLFNMIGKYKGLRNKLSYLIEEYRQSYGEEDPHDLGNLDVLAELPNDLQRTTERALNIIDVILTSLSNKFSEKDFQQGSIQSIIENALSEYPLTIKEKKLIHVDKSIDFQIYGNPFLLKHVLFNLLKNALHYVKVAGKGEIYIWTAQQEDRCFLYFKDTGKGISKNMAAHVFDDFFTKTDYGTGIGLSFCRKVILDMGGKITCEAVEGEFVQFILTFSVLK